MTLWKFLLLSEENQHQIIRLRGHKLKTRVFAESVHTLYQVNAFYVETAMNLLSNKVRDIKYFDNLQEVNTYLLVSFPA